MYISQGACAFEVSCYIWNPPVCVALPLLEQLMAVSIAAAEAEEHHNL